MLLRLQPEPAAGGDAATGAVHARIPAGGRLGGVDNVVWATSDSDEYPSDSGGFQSGLTSPSRLLAGGPPQTVTAPRHHVAAPRQNVTAPRAKRQRGSAGLVAMLCIAASIHSANECGQFSSNTPTNTGLNARQLEESSRKEVIVDSSPALTQPYTMHFLGLVRELSPHFLHHCLVYIEPR